MKRMICYAVTVGVFAGLAAGCGGGGGTHYTMQPIFDCMNSAGVSVRFDTANPLFPSDALALDADFRDFDVYLGVMSDNHQAKSTASDVRAAGETFGSTTAAVNTSGNVIYYSNDRTMNDDAKRIVKACLSGYQATASSAVAHFNTEHPIAYDSDFTSGFLTECAGSGNVERCQCVLTHAERQYTQEQFSEISKALNDPASKWYDDGQNLLTVCR